MRTTHEVSQFLKFRDSLEYVLYEMPNDITKLPEYFENVEHIFISMELYKWRNSTVDLHLLIND